jgi:hypothetical protein
MMRGSRDKDKPEAVEPANGGHGIEAKGDDRLYTYGGELCLHGREVRKQHELQ